MKQGVLKMEWWIQNRKGVKKEKIEWRLAARRKLAESYEMPEEDQ